MRLLPKSVHKRHEVTKPTPAELDAAEDAMYSAMCRGNTMMEQPTHQPKTKKTQELRHPSRPARQKLLEEQQKSIRGPLDELPRTSPEKFLSNFCENGLECTGCAYQYVS